MSASNVGAHRDHRTMNVFELSRPYTAAVDVDGVLYELVPELRRWFHQRHQIPLHRLPTPTVYDLENTWPITKKMLVGALIEGVQAGEIFWKGAAHQPGLDGLRALKALGCRVVLVSARDLPGVEDLCLEATVSWLTSKDAVYDDVVLASDKNRVDYDFLIDDYEVNVHRAHEVDRDAILVDREWNQSVDLPQAAWPQIPALVAAAMERSRLAA